MNARCFPAAVIAAATLTIWVCFASRVVAQETPTPSVAPNTPATPTAPVWLSSGAEDVLKLSRAKISDDVTLAFVQTSDRHFGLTASGILYLRKEGVSDRVLTAMLSQQSPAVSTPPAPATVPEASAPQYVTPPTTTTVLETAPASTVYLATTPSYYSFYDPWPYWSSWYAYPYLSLGFYWGWGWGWGNYNYGYWGYPYGYGGYWNNYCHNGYYPPTNPNPPPTNGNRPPPPNGNPAAARGSTGTGSRSERPVSAEARQPSNVNQASSSSGFNRVEGRSASTTTARPTSVWSDNGNQPAAARGSAGQPTVASSRSGQTAAPTSLSGSAANNRASSTRPVENRGAAQVTGSGRSSSPTTVWSGSASQRPNATRVNQNTTSVARPSQFSAGSSAVGNRPGGQAATRYASSPASSYQRSSFSASPSYRASGSFSGASRPSMSPSSGGMGNTSAFRGGGGFSGGGAPRMFSGGGGFRGGGGGGGGRHR